MSIIKAATRAAATIATATMLATGVAHAESPAARLDRWHMSGNPLGTCLVDMIFTDNAQTLIDNKQIVLQLSTGKELQIGIRTPGVEKIGFSEGQTVAAEIMFDVDRHAKMYVGTYSKGLLYKGSINIDVIPSILDSFFQSDHMAIIVNEEVNYYNIGEDVRDVIRLLMKCADLASAEPRS